MRISAFPKCYIDDIAKHGTLSVFEWVDMARSLGAEGLEMYEGFLASFDDAYVDRLAEAIHTAGFAMPMMCCSPDFANPDPAVRERAWEREAEMIRITRRLAGPQAPGEPRAACRVLSGQRFPEVNVEQGLEWVVDAITRLIPVAREHDVMLALENHYKDGFWKYPEFAQKQDVFLRVVSAIPERIYFGVQYDPSNAIVAGDDPLALLRAVADRVVTMHASDRYLTEGTRLEDLRQSDGTLGYSPNLCHGVTGKGLNDYDAIFTILRDVGYRGWVSIEDGMNGMEEMRESIAFLKRMREKYFV